MRKAVCFLLILMVLSFAFSAFADCQGIAYVSVKSAMKDALGDDVADRVSGSLDDADLTVQLSDSGACLSVNGVSVQLKDTTAAALNASLQIDQWSSWIEELQARLDMNTAGIELRNDVYSSLFTQSRYVVSDKTGTVALLENELVRWLFSIAGEDLTTLEANLPEAECSELSYFQNDINYLMQLDMTVDGEDYLIRVMHDAVGFTASLYIDTSVTDWDAAISAIEDGVSGHGVVSFLLADEEETYFEITSLNGESEQTWEITKPVSANDEADMDYLLRRNGKKYLDVEILFVPVNAVDVSGMTLESASLLMDTDLADAVKTVLETVEGAE